MELTPTQYFDSIKSYKNKNTDETLDQFYDSALVLLDKYRRLNQIQMMRKLMFVVDCISKERELLKKNINIFIYKDDIQQYINEVENKVVKIIELERYPREIPDELIPIVEETRNIFDKFYVLFTDYTGEIERKVEKERRDKDPILFGVFAKDNQMNDRFYYLGDWEDEFCDLTLEKLISEQGKDIVKTMQTPIDKDNLIKECQRLIEENGHLVTKTNVNNFSISNGVVEVLPQKTKKNIFSKITSIFKG